MISIETLPLNYVLDNDEKNLNTNNKFAAAAAAPIILNIILILSMIISFYLKLNFAKNLSIGVTLAGILQLFILLFFT